MKNSQNFFVYAFAVILFSCIASSAQSFTQAFNEEYYGKFDTSLIPDTRQLYRLRLKPVKNLAALKFPSKPKADATASSGKIFDLRKSGSDFNVVLLEGAGSSPSICVDTNSDLVFGESECVAMTASENKTDEFEHTLKLSIKTTLHDSFPIFLRYKRGFADHDTEAGDRILMQSLLAYAHGKVKIKNRDVMVQYQFELENGTGVCSTTSGLMGIDTDGDGKIKNEPFSLETSSASDDEIVFRLNDLYLSTTRLDMAKNQIVMRSRKAEEYRRAELEVGKAMPDFSFVDFDNKKRMLSEFRGKYLLVDFWGLWCVDCRREIPYQFEAYKRYRSRGFEILGIDTDENMEQVKEVLKVNGIFWTQTRFDSVKELVRNIYRIQEFPSAVFLGPDNKVLVLDQSQLSGIELLKTLDRILPR